MKQKQEELQILDIQIILGLVLLGTVIGFLIVAYNNHLKLEGKIPFWNDEEVKTITVWLKFILLISAIISVALSYVVLEDQKEQNADPKDIDAANLQFWASILAVGAAVLIFVAVSESTSNSNTDGIDIENLEL